MPSFKIIDDISNIKLSSNWIDSVKFDSKGKTVEKNGKQYRLISKKERDFTTLERIGRGFLGAVAVVCTLSIAAFFSKFVRNLFTQEKAKIRFAVVVPQSSSSQKPKPGKSPSEYSISEKEELQSGVVISEEMISKIQTCMKNILQRKEEGGVKLYKSQGKHRVFSLDTAPEYIFKMNANCHTLGRDDSMKARYQAMIKAWTVCRTHALGLLVIPNAKLFTVEAEGEVYEIIAEKKLDLNPSESAQEQYFEEYASSLNETIKQLAVFICKTGYSDVEWRNNPVLNDAPDQFGRRKIGLIDIEEMRSKKTGLFGDDDTQRRGLVRCVTEVQGEKVKDIAEKYDISTSRFESAHAWRKKEIESNNKLKKYYSTHNITTGFEPLVVDPNLLALNLEETGDVKLFVRAENDEFNLETKTVTMRDVVEELLEKINSLILKSETNSSLKGKRYILVNTNDQPFKQYYELGLPPNKLSISKEEEKNRWLTQIINALVEKEYLFKLEKVNGHGYYIQA